MHFSDSGHKCADAYLIIVYCNCLPATILLHKLFRSIVYGVEFTYLVGVTDALKEVSDVLPQTRELKIVF
jgi:hypothetical protein